MNPPERAKPLPGELGGGTGEGLQSAQAMPCASSSVPAPAASGRRAHPPTRPDVFVCREGVAGASPAGGSGTTVTRPQASSVQGVDAIRADAGTVGVPPPPPPPNALQGAASKPGALPCLSSNNSNETPPPKPGKPASDLSPQTKKSACALAWNVQAMATRWGLERLGFLTLTFAQHVTDPKEAQRRLNNLSTGVLRDRYPDGFIRVYERQKSGRIHYHLLVVLGQDVRTGVDFGAFAQGDYRTGSAYLRREWAFWRRTAKVYGFGRTELMPVRSTEEGIGRYVGKYIGKHHGTRKAEDRGVRLVEYSRGARMARTRFGWSSENAAHWRAKVRLFAQIMQSRASDGTYGRPIQTISDLAPVLGPRWAYYYRDFIYSLPVVTPGPGRGILTSGDVYDVNTGEILTR